jgi:hypothetical protein
MSISEEIRAVLRGASGPLTAKEIREGTGDEDYTAEQIGGALFSMFKTGELVRDGEGRGKFTYMLDSNKPAPKRAQPETKPAIASPPPVAKSPKIAAELNGTAISGVIRESALTDHVSIPREDLRIIIAALVARHPNPMATDLRDAVVGAFRCTLTGG